MKRFEWRLQKVLDVKVRQEQLKRTELFRTAEQLAAKRSELLLRQRVLQDLLAEIQGHAALQRLPAQEFCLRHTAADDEQMRRLQEEIAALDRRHREQMAELLALRRFRQGLEKLREQAQEEYIREQEKIEQKELDERAALAFVHRQREALVTSARPGSEETRSGSPFESAHPTPCGSTAGVQESNR